MPEKVNTWAEPLPGPPELGFENFPPLMSRSGSPRAPREKLQNETIADLHSRLAGMERDLEECRNLAQHSSKNVIILCAAEILKRTVNLRGEEGGEGKQFFRPDLFKPVVKGSKVMNMELKAYQDLSQRCIIQRNSIAHFRNIKALEAAVNDSTRAIKRFPQFRKQLPDQCQVIDQFKYFKKAFHRNFI